MPMALLAVTFKVCSQCKQPQHGQWLPTDWEDPLTHFRFVFFPLVLNKLLYEQIAQMMHGFFALANWYGILVRHAWRSFFAQRPTDEEPADKGPAFRGLWCTCLWFFDSSSICLYLHQGRVCRSYDAKARQEPCMDHKGNLQQQMITGCQSFFWALRLAQPMCGPSWWPLPCLHLV